MAPRVFKYGLLRPRVNAEGVLDQMRLSHRYRNTLVEIELERRARVREILSRHPAVDSLREDMERAVGARDAARTQISETRGRRERVTPEQRATVRELVERVKELAQQLTVARRELAKDAAVKQLLAEAEASARARVRAERARCGVYWGTYLLQEAAADASRSSGEAPRFTRYNPRQFGGVVGVQIQGGMPLDELWGTDTQIQIASVSPTAHDPGARRGDRRRASRTTLRLRIGSDEKRRPIWAEWAMILHRPLPDGSIVKRATVHAVPKDCATMSWYVCILVDTPETYQHRIVPTTGTVALNLGYCTRPGGIRVGYLVGNDGHEEEVLVPTDIITRVEKAESIRSIRDRNLDEMRPRLTAWVRGRLDALAADIESRTPADGFLRLGMACCEAPAWFVRFAARGWSWKSPAAFRELCYRWRSQRIAEDEFGYTILETWRYRDQHLERYERGLARHAIGHRDERFKILAKQMASRYRTLVVDDTNLAELARSPPPEREQDEIKTAKRNQRLAAPSLLRQALLNAFGPDNTKELSSVNVTRTCHACHAVLDSPGPSAERSVTCPACSATWDQDSNAARNLLRIERLDDEAGAETARKRNTADRPASRSERIRAARSRKAA